MRDPDTVSKVVRYAVWRVPTTGKGSDSRVVVMDSWLRDNRQGGPLVLMIRAERLPVTDIPGLIDAIASAKAWIEAHATG